MGEKKNLVIMSVGNGVEGILVTKFTSNDLYEGYGNVYIDHERVI